MTQPEQRADRQPAYDAVFDIIRRTPPRSIDDYGQTAENARVWRSVEAALDAMQAAGRLLPALSAAEVDAVKKAALFWFVGEGAMDGPTYEALHDAMKKLFLEPAAEVKP